MIERDDQHLRAFEANRADLVTLAYRMLGEVARAEDMVQEAWFRWQRAPRELESPRAYLLTVVTRLCLNELDSARVRREVSRGDRLPEPIDLAAAGLDSIERLEQVSMAFGVVLERLTAPERAVLLLHDVFDFDHERIARLIGKTSTASRKLLERARRSVRDGRRMLEPSPGEHRRLLHAFTEAASTGNTSRLRELLAEDAVLMSDGGASGRTVAGLRNLRRPLAGAARVAAFVVAASARTAGLFRTEERELNRQPALVFYREERASAVLMLGVANGKIQSVFFYADEARLAQLRPMKSGAHTCAEGLPRVAIGPCEGREG